MDDLNVAVGGSRHGPMLAGMEESVLERPVLGEIVPPVVFVLPAVMAKRAHLRSGESAAIQRGDPKPFLESGFGHQFPAPVMVLCNLLFGPNHSHRLRVILAKRQVARLPELDLVAATIALFGEAGIGGPLAKQPHGVLIQGVQQEDIEKAAAIEIRQPGQQPQRRGVLALTESQPFDGEERFHGATDDLATDGAVVILNLFDGVAIAVFAFDSPLQTGVTATAVAGKNFDAIKGSDDVALAASKLHKL